ncbi:uracil-DNA glycosylase [Methylobacterium sp. E-045]|uniref:uracil-DNA glycosylase n=1 Tax=Methylobacterium sp. E-045 TaxID=2836575 RepID=UPI001FBAB083|nr:uracil-DNA glycosylase [Methylobacterium sp. E-045]MCJ2129004.1 uracil-DNA glycosylase [Methylobacterium sp. E-045]
MAPEPDAVRPKSLADPEQVALRRACRDAAHVAPLRALARRISAEQAAEVPDADPRDGGIGARILLLLETPSSSIGRTGFVSRDNPTGTAANLFRFMAEAGIARRDSLIWNAVPWIIHAPGAPNRAPGKAEIASAATYLAPLIDLLPSLAVVVLAGRVAGLSREPLSRLRPGIPILAIPHPSPTFVCTSPLVAQRIVEGLGQAAAMLLPDRPSPAEGPR